MATKKTPAAPAPTNPVVFSAAAIQAGWGRVINLGRENLTYTTPYYDEEDGLRLMQPGERPDPKNRPMPRKLKRFEASVYMPMWYIEKLLTPRMRDSANPNDIRPQPARLVLAPPPGNTCVERSYFERRRQVCIEAGSAIHGTAQPDPITVVNGTVRVTYPGLSHSELQALVYLQGLRRRETITGYLRVDKRPTVQEYGECALRLMDYNIKRAMNGEPTVDWKTMLETGDPSDYHQF